MNELCFICQKEINDENPIGAITTDEEENTFYCQKCWEGGEKFRDEIISLEGRIEEMYSRWIEDYRR